MASNLAGFGIPFILDVPKSREEKIEEARQSGLIGKSHKDIKNVTPNEQVMCCKRCGSRNVVVGMLGKDDDEKGAELPYYCNNCGYSGTRVVRIKKVEQNEDGSGRVIVDLVPDGLVGITGSFVGEDY